MAELAASSNAVQLTVVATAVAVARGARLALNSSGTVAAAASTVRGDFVASQAAAASGTLSAFQIQAGGIIPCIAAEAIAVGDTVYSAASGKVALSSSSTVLIGKANQAASADGVIFEVLVNNPL
jgi:hypothetical protein